MPQPFRRRFNDKSAGGNAMRKRTGAVCLTFAATLGCSSLLAAESPWAKLDMAPTKEGSYLDGADITKLCGTKPIRVALSEGFTANSWRKTVFAEFEDEAKKCPNIKEVLHTDGQGNTQKQISDIEALAAQHVDVIVIFPDGGEALIKAMRDATAAGSAVVPYDTGMHWPGVRLRDDLVAVTENQITKSVKEAEWAVEALHGKGNILELGGIPGNPTTAMAQEGWNSVFKKYPGIKVLEGGPVYVNWDPAETQRVVSGLLPKYPQIDATMDELGSGSVGALRAFKAAGRPLPLTVSEDVNELGCYYKDSRASDPKFNIITVSSGSWIARLALRKGVAAVEGLDDPEASIVTMTEYENTTKSDPTLAARCDKSFPPDTSFSSFLTKDQLKALLK
jgi:ribose transport system substrate-binding protein